MIIAATGHRPDKLGGYSPAVGRRLRDLAIEHLMIVDVDAAISGMAIGWDTAWAEAALELDVPLIAAVPFEGQERRWPSAAQSTFRRILERAAEVHIVCDGGYAAWKMQRRNEWMVDRADRLVALWDGSDGGTANCITYCRRAKKPFDNLWPKWT